MARLRLRATKPTLWVFSFEAMLLLSMCAQSGKQKGTPGVRPPRSQTPPSGVGESPWRPWAVSRQVGEQTECSRELGKFWCAHRNPGSPREGLNLGPRATEHLFLSGWPGLSQIRRSDGITRPSYHDGENGRALLRRLLALLTNTVMVNHKEDHLRSGSKGLLTFCESEA